MTCKVLSIKLLCDCKNMNFISPVPPLQRITLTKIAVSLWNDINFGDRLPPISEMHEELEVRMNIWWLEKENEVLAKVQQLPLPAALREKIERFIRPVGIEISHWLKCHPKFHGELPSYVFWTVHGTIDRKKTASALIKDESIDVVSRYIVACNYCLADDIPQLWSRIPNKSRKSLCFMGDHLELNMFSRSKVVAYWTYNLRGKMTLFERQLGLQRSPYHYALDHAAEVGNEAAAVYFFGKLSPLEKGPALVSSARLVSELFSDFQVDHLYGKYYADVECFLLSKASETQQLRIFRDDSLTVLKFFLEWPRQSLFIEVANHVRDFLSKQDFYLLLEEIITKVKLGYKDYDYQSLIVELWRESPDVFKRFFLDYQLVVPTALSNMLEMKCSKIFFLIWKDATFEEKRKFIFIQNSFYFCNYLLYDNEGYILEFFIRECKLSKDERKNLKHAIKSHSYSLRFEEQWKIQNWKKAIQRLDDFIDEG